MKCDGEGDALRILEDPTGGCGVMKNNGDSGNNGGESSDTDGKSCCLTPTLVHIAANVLYHPG